MILVDERQIIVVSKIDKHDKGIADKLQGIGSGSLYLPLGCVAVLNRKQEEIDANISFEEMRRREEEFFRTNPAFVDVPKEHLGTGQLIKKLVTIQQERIRHTLPHVIDGVEKAIRLKREELKNIPAAILTETDVRIAFTKILRDYRAAIEQSAKGEYEIKPEQTGIKFDPDAHDKWDERIAYHLKMIGAWVSQKIQEIFSNFSTKNQCTIVLQSIEENYGGGLPNIPSTNIVQHLYKPYHQKLAEPCKYAVLWIEQYISACLAFILGRVIPAEASYKETLSRELNGVIKNVIENCKEKCMENVEQMLMMEEKVFTVNPYYIEVFNKRKSEGQ